MTSGPSTAVRPWNVYRVDKFPEDPLSSEWKFFIPVFAQGEDWFGFYINTHIGKFDLRDPDAEIINPIVRRSEHGFLTYDSHLGCARMVTYTTHHILSSPRVGLLSISALRSVRIAVNTATTLKEFQVEAILLALLNVR